MCKMFSDFVNCGYVFSYLFCREDLDILLGFLLNFKNNINAGDFHVVSASAMRCVVNYTL